MEPKKQLNQIFSKKMSREGFIKHIAIGAVAMLWGGVLLRMRLSNDASREVLHQGGYGSSAYGGKSQDQNS